MVINGSEKLAIEWTFEGFLVIAQRNQSVKLTPAQADALREFLAKSIDFQLKYDGTATAQGE